MLREKGKKLFLLTNSPYNFVDGGMRFMLEVFTYKNLILTSFCVLKVEDQYPVTFTITLLQWNSWPAIIFFFQVS